MADRLRVVLLTAKMSPAAGGLAVSVPGLAHRLDAFDDIETHVLGTQDPADPMAAQGWGPRVSAFAAVGPSALQRAPAMAPALAKLAPDIVDVQGLWTWVSKISLDHHRATGKPYMVTPRGMLDPWALRHSSWKKRLFAAFVESAHLRHATVLRATAEMEAQHFRDMGLRAPVAIVPNAIMIPQLSQRSVSNGRRRVLFLSRIHPKKGIAYLLNAWAALEQRFPDWDLVIAGIDENGHEAEMKARAKELVLTRVSFPGPLHGSDKDALYRSADLFVLPTHAENFGLVVAEALAQEVPVITTRNAPWEGLKTHRCGWWIDLVHYELLAALTEAMSKPRRELRAMGARGRAWIARDFGWDDVGERMRMVYCWMVRSAPRPDFLLD